MPLRSQIPKIKNKYSQVVEPSIYTSEVDLFCAKEKKACGALLILICRTFKHKIIIQRSLKKY